ncbi:TPA: YraN family protein [Candidatus Dependentiae bacterium]|nr:MAG: hypothetical protein UW09_C0001G0092 [candidate division TM6 bacterium GW2011_GWF2_43_87]HBL98543.1 YraN family protein [Candidatus Dependentiae bacterium]
MNYRKSLGQSGEAAVATYLKNEGFTVCVLNYQCRAGEIDIIAEKPGLRVFVEVKTRVSEYFDTSEVVTPTKQRRIISTACYYNQRQNRISAEWVYRFDIAIVHPAGDKFSIRYIPNAFAPSVEYFS